MKEIFLMARECGDCIYYIIKDDYCNKHKKVIPESEDKCAYQTPACGYFISDSLDNCNSCRYGKDIFISFICKKRGAISNPSYYRCNDFMYK